MFTLLGIIFMSRMMWELSEPLPGEKADVWDWIMRVLAIPFAALLGAIAGLFVDSIFIAISHSIIKVVM